MRELIKSVTVTKTFSKSATSGRYNLDTLTSIKNSHHKNWALGEQFQNEVLDSTQHLVRILNIKFRKISFMTFIDKIYYLKIYIIYINLYNLYIYILYF